MISVEMISVEMISLRSILLLLLLAGSIYPFVCSHPVFQEKELVKANKYADIAIQADRYNPSALVNKGNCLFKQREYERAREYYKEALQNDSSLPEALYNLGLAHKKLGRYDHAVESFLKLQNILRNSAQVIYQIASCHELMSQGSLAQESYMQLIGLVPSEHAVMRHLGELADREQDMTAAFGHYYDSYRFNPSNIDVIQWLGVYYIESQFAEKAISYFQRAAVVQPNEVNWPLMVASCYRRAGNYQAALQTYKTISRKFPDNIECLKRLVTICRDLGLPETEHYETKLANAHKNKELRDEREGSAGARKSSGRQTSGRGRGGGADDQQPKVVFTGKESYQTQPQNTTDVDYADPLEHVVRPRTAAVRKPNLQDDEFADEEIGDDLLPE